MTEFAKRPLMVIALGGNALSPPDATPGYGAERVRVKRTAQELRKLLDMGCRLLLVPGNGPQVGRLMQSARSTEGDDGVNLDIHVAQTQGELGYLIAAALTDLRAEESFACVITRVLVAGMLGDAVKPVGPVLSAPPASGPASRSGTGWRILVPSPRPHSIVELEVIRTLLDTSHVIAGGGGGVPLAIEDGSPLDCVIDKDWIASLLAISLDASGLIFATNVPGVMRNYQSPSAELIESLEIDEAARGLQAGDFAAGSMAPKVAAAADYSVATGRSSVICNIADIGAAAHHGAGTRIVP